MGFLSLFRSFGKKNRHQSRELDVLYGTSKSRRYFESSDLIIERIIDNLRLVVDTEDGFDQIHGENICTACAMRDLRNCTLIDRQWAGPATKALYSNVSLDGEHTCEIGNDHAFQQRTHSAREKNASRRLKLFLRTVKSDEIIASMIHSLTPASIDSKGYIADLARTVTFLQNLKYIELPQSACRGIESMEILRMQLQANCPQICSTSYLYGAEDQVISLAQDRYWTKLQSLELCSLKLDTTTVRQTLGVLPQLQNLKLVDMRGLSDFIFCSSADFPQFPALRKLHVENDGVTSSTSIMPYLARTDVVQKLESLSLIHCQSFAISSIPDTLARLPNLKLFSIATEVTESLEEEAFHIRSKLHQQGTYALETPLIQSHSLQTLCFEVFSDTNCSTTVVNSYYHWLVAALRQKRLPSLRKLYVQDESFIQKLTESSGMPKLGNKNPFLTHPGSSPQIPSPITPKITNAEFLELYTKGASLLPWTENTVSTLYPNEMNDDVNRPVDAFEASRGLGARWTGEARKSVLIGNGIGGLAPVPLGMVDGDVAPPSPILNDGRPIPKTNAQGKRFSVVARVKDRSSRMDMWR